MNRNYTVLLVALAGFLLAVLMCVVLYVTSPPTAYAQDTSAKAQAFGWFQWCEPTRTGMFDPIMYPRQPGASHRHIYTGNKSVTAFSTRATLMQGKSTCSFADGTTGGNHSLYWVQDLKLRDGTFAGAAFTTAYYTAWPGIDPNKITVPPAGIKAIIRNVPGSSMQWACAGRDAAIRGLREWPHDCDPNSQRPYVTLNIKYPSCSDGRKDSADHISHLRFPKANGECPVTHPRAIPRLRMGFRFDTWKGKGARLSDGGSPATLAHGDYFNAWNQTKIKKLVRGCIHAELKCWRDPAKRGVFVQ